MTDEHPIAVFLKARWDEIDPDDAHHRHECDFRQLEFFGDCSCRVPELTRRDIEAKRQILDEHSITNDSVCSTCVTGRWGYPAHGGADPQPYPCRTLRLLAQRDADHDDFDPGWSTD